MSDFSIFSVLGLEIEYMLVDKDTLDVQPKSDLILKALAGELVNEVKMGEIAASNELVMHVLELKNNGPKSPQAPFVAQFQQAIDKIQPLLAQHNLEFLPTGAHPWMNPQSETKRWPHGNNAIYKKYDEIFNCQGHGWSNLQSMHVNMPFANDEEFNQLHNAIRLILPLLPALAASSPFLDGKKTGFKDSRLYFYGKNQQQIPSIAGDIIPEFIQSEAIYKQTILTPMYKDISVHDPEGILQQGWLNSRAAIPKFDVKAIEIRILDSQESVQADIAIALVIQAILQYLQRNSDYYLDKPCETHRLRTIYDEAIKEGLSTKIDDAEFSRQWNLPASRRSATEFWSRLIERVSSDLDKNSQSTLEYILSQGNLSERILRACGSNLSKTTLVRVYRQLSHCLRTNQMFNAS
ncbi:MAG: glutamate--cysteine ligase [Tatlockia sp.]|nr:glutamate--cysteine ligase [Tatlockia sp.]